MKKLVLFMCVVAAGFLFGCSFSSKTDSKTSSKYPIARADTSVSEDYFGTVVKDPYRWMEIDTAQEVKEWIEQENACTQNYLNPIPFRNNIREAISSLWNYEKVTSPIKFGKKELVYKNTGLENQSTLFLKKADGTLEEFINPNNLSKDGTVALGSIAPSFDGKFLAYSTSIAGSDWTTIKVKNASGKELKDVLDWVKFSSISWYKDGFFYSRYDEVDEATKLSGKNQNHKVYYHKIGTPQKSDVLTFENKKVPSLNHATQTFKGSPYLAIYSSKGADGNSVTVINLETKKRYVLATGLTSHWNIINVDKNVFTVKTDKNAPTYKVLKMVLKGDSFTKSKFIDSDSSVINTVKYIKGYYIVTKLVNAYSKVLIYNEEGDLKNELKLPFIGTVGGISESVDEGFMYYTITSFDTPADIYKYNLEKNTAELYYKTKLSKTLSKFDIKQVFYTSKDGTKVPMFVVSKKGLDKKTPRPTILYGYGGFNIPLTPSFSVTNALFVENGGIYVVANIRGGGEFGSSWHKAGTKSNKQNVFDDFIGAAEFLIKEKYTSSEKLAIQGGSNGGLLVGACLTQRPELFKVALPAVGVLDMLRFHTFTIGWAWKPDYGSSESKEGFETLYKYSPLHNIKDSVEYPATLITTGDHDDRVVPAHSFKFAATLQAAQKGNNPVLIRVETNAGHGAGKPTSKRIEEATDVLSFTLFSMQEKFTVKL